MVLIVSIKVELVCRESRALDRAHATSLADRPYSFATRAYVSSSVKLPFSYSNHIDERKMCLRTLEGIGDFEDEVEYVKSTSPRSNITLL